MGYPGPPPYPPTYPPAYPPPWPPPPPRRNPADVAVSVIVMILTVLVCAAGALMGLMSLAFLDHCPPGSCSAEGAVIAVMATVAIAALVGLTGLILTIARLVGRKSAWPFAVGTLAGCVGVFFLGGIAYTAAVG